MEFDIALLLAEGRAHAPDLFSYIYEMPREVSRYTADCIGMKVSIVEGFRV